MHRKESKLASVAEAKSSAGRVVGDEVKKEWPDWVKH